MSKPHNPLNTLVMRLLSADGQRNNEAYNEQTGTTNPSNVMCKLICDPAVLLCNSRTSWGNPQGAWAANHACKGEFCLEYNRYSSKGTHSRKADQALRREFSHLAATFILCILAKMYMISLWVASRQLSPRWLLVTFQIWRFKPSNFQVGVIHYKGECSPVATSPSTV